MWKAYRAAAGLEEEALRRLTLHAGVELVELTPSIRLAQDPGKVQGSTCILPMHTRQHWGGGVKNYIYLCIV